MASFIGERMGSGVGIAEGSRQSLAQHHAGLLSLQVIVPRGSKLATGRVRLGVPFNRKGFL